MSQNEKRESSSETRNAKNVPAREERGMRASRRRSSDLLATFDDVMDDFRKRFIDNFWSPFPMMPMEGGLLMKEAAADLIDEGDKFIVRAEVPGIPKDELDIAISETGVEISGKMEREMEKKEKNYVLRESGYQSIYRKLAFPEEVAPDKAEANMKDGILEINVPKKTPTPEPKTRKLQVK